MYTGEKQVDTLSDTVPHLNYVVIPIRALPTRITIRKLPVSTNLHH